MEPEKIRTLLSASPAKFETVAKQLELPLPVAQSIRLQAMNLVLGKCVLCGKFTLVGMCAHCRKSAPQWRMIPWSSVTLLKMMNPSDQLLRQTCDRCGRAFMLSASYLLRKLLLKHTEEPKQTCNSCIEKAQEAERRLRIQKLEQERRQKLEEKRKIIEERRARQAEAARRRQAAKKREADRRPQLIYQPFAGNQDLARLRKELPKAPHQPHPKNSPKRAKTMKNRGFSR